MRQIKADLSKLDVLISKQYEDKIRGFAKDSLQNSWEARVNRKHGSGFKMVYEFFEEIDGHRNILMFEDFGTVGMDSKRWNAFHGHWITTKADYEGGIGRWGQGKTLYLYFSKKNRLLTESIDLLNTKNRYSIRTNTGFWEENDIPEQEDPKWVKKSNGRLKLVNDFFPSVSKLDHVGTRIWILDLRDELLDEIVDGYFEKQLSESWWELIRNYKIELWVKIHQGGLTHNKIVKLPSFPTIQDKVVKDKGIIVEKGHGKIRKLKIALAKEPIQTSLRGIAIQRGRMTVCLFRWNN